MTNLKIEVANRSSPDLLRAVKSLLPQLMPSGRSMTAAELETVIASPLTTLLVAKDGDKIIGMISLAVVQMPTGLRSYLEDLVVDSSCRKRGTATALLRAAIDLARNSAACTMDLTSRSSRTEANRLFERLGFERRDTNPYRYVFYE
jgi:ribosomal protein S18 acetylase RimI-like enzyme